MTLSRRKFMKLTGGAFACGMLSWKAGLRSAWAFNQSPTTIPLFGTPLRGIGTIGVAAADPFVAPVTGVTHYTIAIDEFTDAGVVPTLGPTTLRGFNATRLLAGEKNRHLGGIIVGQKGVPIQITFKNRLGVNARHPLPVDRSIMGADLGDGRTCVHFHGGLVPWISDGGPHAWWDASGKRGPSFLNNAVLNPRAAANEAEFHYPLNQSARFGWYHDHTLGMTRLNAYGGMASAIFIRDAFELGLVNQGLPNYIEGGGNEIPLVFQDKIFVGPKIQKVDPTWSVVAPARVQGPGSLWYAHVYETSRWEFQNNGGCDNQLALHSSVIPEFFGDTMLVNGTAFPSAKVEPRRYRLRLLNACNARFLNLQLYIADGSKNGITLDGGGVPRNDAAGCDPNTPGTASLLQIGTEGGFLPRPIRVATNLPFDPVTMTGSLLVAPAERPDVIVDFSKLGGKSVILYNDAPSPFPMGDPLNDYFPGLNAKDNPINGATPDGFGPNSRVLMRFEVAAHISGAPDLPLTIDTSTDLSPGLDAPLVPFGVSEPPMGLPVRKLTLNETFDAYGRLIQMLGTSEAPSKLDPTSFGRAYDAPSTENVAAGATEVWEVYNTTGDVHPMHFHLVNFQVINRQPVDLGTLFADGTATFTGPTTPCNPDETGWKETVKMFPGTVTRLIMKFDLPSIGGVKTPVSPRTGGHEFVWHCHILEHEEHDMMRPLIVG